MAQLDEATGQQGRRHQRLRSSIRVEVIVDRERRLVQLCNLSPTGAMLKGQGLPRRGVELIVCAGDLHVVATVIWTRGRTCGVILHRSIDAAKIVHNQAGH